MKKYIILCLISANCLAGPPFADFIPRSEGPHYPLTPLTEAIKKRDFPETKSLLEKGADPNERGDLGSSPLFIALTIQNYSPEYLKFMDLLLQHQADPNAFIQTGCNSYPLDWALENLSAGEHIELLLQRGADPFKMRRISKRCPYRKSFNQSVKRLRKERTQRCSTLLLCIKKAPTFLPPDMVNEIKGHMRTICTPPVDE